ERPAPAGSPRLPASRPPPDAAPGTGIADDAAASRPRGGYPTRSSPASTAPTGPPAADRTHCAPDSSAAHEPAPSRRSQPGPHRPDTASTPSPRQPSACSPADDDAGQDPSSTQTAEATTDPHPAAGHPARTRDAHHRPP